LRGKRLLVADDNATNRMILSAMLKKLGVEARFANDGAEACRLWRVETFDLVLLDISMPVMDGLEALQVMKAEGFGRFRAGFVMRLKRRPPNGAPTILNGYG